jgi:hypothetical protein
MREFRSLFVSVAVCAAILLAVSCASLRTQQVRVVETVRLLSEAVLSVQDVSHTAAMALNTPTALQLDIEVQQAARAYGEAALVALEQVQRADTVAQAFVAAAPIVAMAQRMVELLLPGDLGPDVAVGIGRVQAYITALEEE